MSKKSVNLIILGLIIHTLLTVALDNIRPKFACCSYSWCWYTETIPYDIMIPVFITATICEFFVLYLLCSNKRITDIIWFALIVCAKNVFLYLNMYFRIFYISSAMPTSELLSLSKQSIIHDVLDNNGLYIISPTYYVLLLILTPVAYFVLRNITKDNKQFLITLIIFNLLAAITVFYVERIICYGNISWIW